MEASLPSLERLPKAFLRRLFLFDYWIQNEDRSGTEAGGNPNLFLDLTTLEPIVLDHNLAFDDAFDFDMNRAIHICSTAWYQPAVDLIFPAAAKDDMRQALTSLEGLREQLPVDWLEREPHHFDRAIAELSRCDTDEFWEALK